MQHTTYHHYDGHSLIPQRTAVSYRIQFDQMCFEQMSFMKQNPVFAKGFCQVAGAYIEYCKENSVEMWLPGECYNCHIPDGSPIRGGQFWDFFNNTAPKNTDIVLILQHGPCIDDFDFKILSRL